MAPRASFVVIALALALSAVTSGCGPSLRRVHQGNLYFERCYAADLDTLVPAEERRACWQAWHAHYQTGASPERIDHATERLAMLDPERAEAIALATGADPVETETSESGLVEIVSAEPEIVVPLDGGIVVTAEVTTEVTVTPVPVTTTEPPPPAVDIPPPTHEEIVESVERARAEERRSHRRIVVPRSSSPHCARTCQPAWEACTAHCTADQRACVNACRRELTICSRGCY